VHEFEITATHAPFTISKPLEQQYWMEELSAREHLVEPETGLTWQARP
jgi:hypothetical protein